MRFASLVLLLACNGQDGTDDPAEIPVDWPTLDCDPIVEYCAFPFPSNVFTEADDSTPTGRRVALSRAAMPRVTFGDGTEPEVFNRADGFSPGGPFLAHLPGATEAGLTPASDPAASLDDDSLTIVIDAETGERVPHWAELDHLSTDFTTDQTFMMFPALRLADSTRYIVAIRGVTDDTGAVLPPTPAFAALRDGTELGDPAVDARADLYDDIFAMLEATGWDRDEVQLAWDFTTRSKEDLTGWLLHMRDEALAAVGPDGPEYVITSVETDWNTDHIAYRIFGEFEAPLYLDQTEPGARLLFGDDGLPEVNAAMPTMTVPFEVLIPQSAVSDGPAPLIMYGHGQFGDKEQIESGTFREFIDDYGYVMFGVDLIGMASDDGEWLETPTTTPLIQARFHDVTAFHDRLHQGMLNHILAMRLMKARFSADPDHGDFVDGETAFYYGISQGGIMGPVHAAVSQDFERAALGVMGQPYSLLLPRSVNFTPFFDILAVPLVDGRDVHFGLSLVQQTWSRVEADGWSAYVTGNTVDAATPAKQVFLRAARGDHQVTNLGAHIMARTMGATQVPSGWAPAFDLPTDGTVDGGAAYVEYDYGLPPLPPCNLPMSLCEDPHGFVRSEEAAKQQLDAFFRTGTVTNTCEAGVCFMPELGMCESDEDDAAAEALCEE